MRGQLAAAPAAAAQAQPATILAPAKPVAILRAPQTAQARHAAAMASGACNSSVTTSCGLSDYCSGGSCTPKETSGTCTSGIECTSGNCAIPTGATSGICCATGDSDSEGICCAAGSSNLNGSGVCCSSSYNAICSGSCTNTTSDPNNCGRCGKVCTGGASCSGGECKCPSGTSAVRKRVLRPV